MLGRCLDLVNWKYVLDLLFSFSIVSTYFCKHQLYYMCFLVCTTIWKYLHNGACKKIPFYIFFPNIIELKLHCREILKKIIQLSIIVSAWIGLNVRCWFSRYKKSWEVRWEEMNKRLKKRNLYAYYRIFISDGRRGKGLTGVNVS